jgi:hypothetical protein
MAVAYPPVTVTFSSVTGKLTPSVNVVPLLVDELLPFSTLSAEESDPVPLPSIVRLASLPLLTEKSPSKQVEAVQVPLDPPTRSIVTASPL